MKLVSLNILGGYFFDPLMQFITEESKTTDVFCFQEVLATKDNILESDGMRANIFSEILSALSEFEGYFAPLQDHFNLSRVTEFNISMGEATFVRKKFPVKNHDSILLCGKINAAIRPDNESIASTILVVELEIEDKPLFISNFHGVAYPGSKLDTELRIQQSKNILNLFKKQTGAKIIVGDFNLIPRTKSIALLEKSGMKNLIKEYNIPTTRGSNAKKINPQYANTEEGFQEFADYALVSSEVRVTHFSVPDVPVSDHLPLILEYELR